MMTHSQHRCHAIKQHRFVADNVIPSLQLRHECVRSQAE